jgi:hypothetical protein
LQGSAIRLADNAKELIDRVESVYGYGLATQIFEVNGFFGNYVSEVYTQNQSRIDIGRVPV